MNIIRVGKDSFFCDQHSLCPREYGEKQNITHLFSQTIFDQSCSATATKVTIQTLKFLWNIRNINDEPLNCYTINSTFKFLAINYTFLFWYLIEYFASMSKCFVNKKFKTISNKSKKSWAFLI